MIARTERKFKDTAKTYVTADAVYVDIPIEIFIQEYEFQKSKGLSSEKALENCKLLCKNEMVSVAHQIPVGV